MKTQNLKLIILFLAAALMLGGFAVTGAAQISAFTCQGRFTDSSVTRPTNGTRGLSIQLLRALIERGRFVRVEEEFNNSLDLKKT